jgi:hypothetical protein
VRLYAWQGEGLFEVAFVDLGEDRLTARGTQLRSGYSLSYALETSEMFVSEHLHVEVETVHGAGRLDLRRGTKPLRDDVLDLDLQASPLFNSWPVLRDRLHEGGDAREYVMAFVKVPELSVARSTQRYVPLARGVVRFRSGAFTSDIEFDADGFVLRYPGLAERVS